MYYTHTGRPGSLKQRDFNQMLEKDPARPLKLAVKGMLPRGPLGRQMLAKLKVVIGSEHPYIAQQPKEYVDNFKHTSEGE
jgi:large subunit ribosomal protein L13